MGAAHRAGCQVKKIERREGGTSGHSRLTPSDSAVVPHLFLVLRYSRSRRHCCRDGSREDDVEEAEAEAETSEEEENEEEEEQLQYHPIVYYHILLYTLISCSIRKRRRTDTRERGSA